MAESIYQDLREQLDQYSVGFPATESGIEFRILEKLFTEEDAGLFLDLSLMLEPPESVAARTGRDPEETAAHLEDMANRGLLFRIRRKGVARYGASAFVIGSWEYQVGRLDKELAQLVDTYLDEAYCSKLAETATPLRTVPVNLSIPVSWQVAAHDDARYLIESAKKIAVAPCICRTQQGLLDSGCDKPVEVCLVFGSHADYYVDNKMARYIDKDEALAILKKSDEAGLVHQPANAINPGGMCNCCGDCCGILRALKRHPKPASMVTASYQAFVDPDVCIGCEMCEDRCQMGAITYGERYIAFIDVDRCIGCGLCVTSCTVDAVSLVPVAEEHRRSVPKDAREYTMRVALERGKSLTPLSMQKGAK